MSTQEERFDEVVSEECKLKEWTFWEIYEAIGGVSDTKVQYLSNQKKVAWFNDIISFWQVWNTLPLKNLKNYFYDVSTNSFLSHFVNGNQMRVATLSIFLKDVMPKWEDPANTNGGEY